MPSHGRYVVMTGLLHSYHLGCLHRQMDNPYIYEGPLLLYVDDHLMRGAQTSHDSVCTIQLFILGDC